MSAPDELVPDEPTAFAASPPAVQVVRGAPDEAELAALVAGLVATAGRAATAGAGAPDEPATPRAEWSSRRRVLPHRTAPALGPDTWRWSLHP